MRGAVTRVWEQETGMSGTSATTRDRATIPPPDFAASALFLDFDGTLVEIAPRPDAVTLPPGLSGLLTRLDEKFAGGVTLISGRPLADLDRFLPHHTGPAIGGHGAEWRHRGETWTHPFADAPERVALIAELSRWARGRDGLLVEPKPTGVGVHYRDAPDFADMVEARLSDALANHPELELHRAKMAFELRPADIGKDRAMRAMLERLGVSKAVMIGDDATDEPAMALAQESGGLAIKVGPGDSLARHRLADPGGVLALLQRWAS